MAANVPAVRQGYHDLIFIPFQVMAGHDGSYRQNGVAKLNKYVLFNHYVFVCAKVCNKKEPV
jgi:hypothetical protein